MEMWIGIIGWAGSAMVVTAYALNMSGKIAVESGFYLWANIIGSICLIINTAFIGAYPSAFVNIIWVVIGLWGIGRQKLKVLKG